MKPISHLHARPRAAKLRFSTSGSGNLGSPSASAKKPKRLTGLVEKLSNSSRKVVVRVEYQASEASISIKK